MKILYFARIRQIAGRSMEEVEVPSSVSTVSDLITFLSGRDEGVAAALSEPSSGAVEREDIKLLHGLPHEVTHVCRTVHVELSGLHRGAKSRQELAPGGLQRVSFGAEALDLGGSLPVQCYVRPFRHEI